MAASAFRSSVAPRAYSTASGSTKSNTGLYIGGILGAAGAVGAYYYYQQGLNPLEVLEGKSSKKVDYQKVYNAIADVLESNGDYDDGSYGPVLVRLAWHSAGTYDKASNTGGSNGATMRFHPESEHAANAGLNVARDVVEEIHKQFPEVSYADLFTLAGVVAVQEMGGPAIPWRPGRADIDLHDIGAHVRPEGRLPDGAKGKPHLRDIFYRMGWNDQEIVALSGAHALGRCHTDRSGFDGPWTFSPTSFTNDYYVQLMENSWKVRSWKGPKQFQDKSKSLMMLPTDMALLDKDFKPYVEKYAKSQDAFFNDFSNAFSKLLELGVPFDGTVAPMVFTPSHGEKLAHPTAKQYAVELHN